MYVFYTCFQLKTKLFQLVNLITMGKYQNKTYAGKLKILKIKNFCRTFDK